MKEAKKRQSNRSASPFKEYSIKEAIKKSKEQKGESTPELLKQVKFGDSLTVHRVDMTKLSQLLHDNENQVSEQQLKEIETKQILQMNEEMIQKANQITAEGDGELKANRRVLQFDKAAKFKKEGAGDQNLGPMSGAAVQVRYIEQWLNDVLRDAEELNMTGILRRPEHKNPLNRYEIDRSNLLDMKVSMDTCDRVYRALFVHSVGFFELLKESTKSVVEGKEKIQANIWRVFQILLEYACKTDYTLVTQQMEKTHQEKLEDLTAQIAQLTQDYMDKDQELQNQMKQIKVEYIEMEKEKAIFENERIKIFEELHKIQRKLEDEIKLRLFFESKLNSLHHINMDHESKNKLLTEKLEKLQEEHADLETVYAKIKEEHEELTIYKMQAEQELKMLSIKEEMGKQENVSQKSYMTQIVNEMSFHKNEIRETKLQLERIEMKCTKSEMSVQKLSNEVEQKENFNNQIVQFYNQSQEDLEQKKKLIEEQLSEIMTKEKRLKGQDIELKLRERELQRAQDLNKALEEKLAASQKAQTEMEVDFQKQINTREALEVVIQNHHENEDLLRKQIITLELVKKDHDRKLARQMDETKQLKKNLAHVQEIFKKSKSETMRTTQKFKTLKEKYEQVIMDYQTQQEKIKDLITNFQQKELILRQRIITQTDATEQEKEKYQKAVFQMNFLKEEVRNLQLTNSDLESNIEQMQRRLDQFEKELIQTTEKKDTLTKTFQEFQDQKDMVDIENEIMKKQIDQLRTQFDIDVTYYREQLEQKEDEIEKMKMPFEDLLSHIQRQESIITRAKEANEKQERQLKYLSRKFISFLILKEWSRARKQAYQEEVQANKFKIEQQMKFMDLNKEKIDLLSKYKDDMERDKAVLGQQMVENIQKIQVQEGKLKKKDDRIHHLEAKVKKFQEKYASKVYYDKTTQTFELDPTRSYDDDDKVEGEAQTDISVPPGAKFDPDKLVAPTIGDEKPWSGLSGSRSRGGADQRSNERSGKSGDRSSEKASHILKDMATGKTMEYKKGMDIPEGFKLMSKQRRKESSVSSRILNRKRKSSKHDPYGSTKNLPQGVIGGGNNQLSSRRQSMMHQISSPLKFKVETSSKISGMLKSSKRDGQDSAGDIPGGSDSRLKDLISNNSKQPYDDGSNADGDALDFAKDQKLTRTEMNFNKPGDKPYDESSYQPPKSAGPIDLDATQEIKEELSSVSDNDGQQFSLSKKLKPTGDSIESDDRENLSSSSRYRSHIEEEETEISSISLNDTAIIKFFEGKTKEQVEPVVRKLNEMNCVKLCGGLGMCFNCRNKNIKMEDFASIGTRNNQSMVVSRSQQNFIAQDKKEYSNFFRDELNRILSSGRKGAEKTIDNITNKTAATFQLLQDSEADVERLKEKLMSSRITHLPKKKIVQKNLSSLRGSKPGTAGVGKAPKRSLVSQGGASKGGATFHGSIGGDGNLHSQSQNGFVINTLIKQYEQNQNPAILLLGSQSSNKTAQIASSIIQRSSADKGAGISSLAYMTQQKGKKPGRSMRAQQAYGVQKVVPKSNAHSSLRLKQNISNLTNGNASPVNQDHDLQRSLILNSKQLASTKKGGGLIANANAFIMRSQSQLIKQRMKGAPLGNHQSDINTDLQMSQLSMKDRLENSSQNFMRAGEATRLHNFLNAEFKSLGDSSIVPIVQGEVVIDPKMKQMIGLDRSNTSAEVTPQQPLGPAQIQLETKVQSKSHDENSSQYVEDLESLEQPFGITKQFEPVMNIQRKQPPSVAVPAKIKKAFALKEGSKTYKHKVDKAGTSLPFAATHHQFNPASSHIGGMVEPLYSDMPNLQSRGQSSHREGRRPEEETSMPSLFQETKFKGFNPSSNQYMTGALPSRQGQRAGGVEKQNYMAGSMGEGFQPQLGPVHVVRPQTQMGLNNIIKL